MLQAYVFAHTKELLLCTLQLPRGSENCLPLWPPQLLSHLSAGLKERLRLRRLTPTVTERLFFSNRLGVRLCW